MNAAGLAGSPAPAARRERGTFPLLGVLSLGRNVTICCWFSSHVSFLANREEVMLALQPFLSHV